MKQEQCMKCMLVVVCAVALYLLLSSKSMQSEGFIVDSNMNSLAKEVQDKQDLVVGKAVVEKTDLKLNGRVELSPNDLLPEDKRDTDFAAAHPLSQGILANKNFLEPGKQIGQLAEPLRNSNLSIRAEPVIERQQISPWQNSTKPLSHGRGLEIV